ncbi:MAG: PocR ligand-binding domain-containing protein [Verrucomicrobia bacterium]|nr:PocR ligand-binding domain-containing protein [Verrucomicrobiota bacterium]
MPTTADPTARAPSSPVAHSTAGLFFRQLVASPEFTEFALILKRLTGLSMALNTPDVGLTRVGVAGDNGSPLCQIIRSTKEGARRCEGCDQRNHAQAGAEGRAKLYQCHVGFYDMAIPVVIQGEHVATISSGQVLPEQQSQAAFARTVRRLRWLNIPATQLQEAYAQAPWLPRDRLVHVMHLLELFARQMCGSAWRIRELEASLEHPAIRPARALVEERFRDPELKLADVAARAGLSPAHFSHLFHKETGVTFTRYVQSRRIDEAKRRLTATGESITEICFACGFNSLTHFNRVFRRGAGASPSQFRRAGAA